MVASASDDRDIILWDIEKQAPSATLKGHQNYVFCVNFNAQGTQVISGDYEVRNFILSMYTRPHHLPKV